MIMYVMKVVFEKGSFDPRLMEYVDRVLEEQSHKDVLIHPFLANGNNWYSDQLRPVYCFWVNGKDGEPGYYEAMTLFDAARAYGVELELRQFDAIEKGMEKIRVGVDERTFVVQRAIERI